MTVKVATGEEQFENMTFSKAIYGTGGMETIPDFVAPISAEVRRNAA